MDAYRTAMIREEPLVSQRAPRRVYVGIAATMTLTFAGAVWIGIAFGGWALVSQVPTLGILLCGVIRQIRANNDPRVIAKRRARNEARADAWLNETR